MYMSDHQENTTKEAQYYRNHKDLELNGEFVDRHSLWRLEGQELVLVDEDRHVTHPLDAGFYRPTEV